MYDKQTAYKDQIITIISSTTIVSEMYIVLIKQAQKVTLKKRTSFKSINISYNLDFISRYNVIFYFCNHYYNVICIRYEKLKWIAPLGPRRLRPPSPAPLPARGACVRPPAHRPLPPRKGQVRTKTRWLYHNCIILKISNYASLRFVIIF